MNTERATHIATQGLDPALGSPNLRHTPGLEGPNLAFIGGSVIVALMAVIVLIGAANAGDLPRSKSAEVTQLRLIKTQMTRLT